MGSHLRLPHSHRQATPPAIPTKGTEMIRQFLSLTSTPAVRSRVGGGSVSLPLSEGMIRINIHPAAPTHLRLGEPPHCLSAFGVVTNVCGAEKVCEGKISERIRGKLVF